MVRGHAAYEVAKAWWDEQPDATVSIDDFPTIENVLWIERALQSHRM
jgi:hypothetical protein